MATSLDLQLTAHIPIAIQGPLLTMSFENAITGDYSTIFVGVVDANYTEAMWNDHKKQLSKLFGITSLDCIKEMKLECPGPIIDQGLVLSRMTEITAFINERKSTILRIVGLGVGSSQVITDALEALIRQWNIPLDQKHVQFVSLGESEDYHYLNFCRGLCMKQVCKNLQYYNTMDFNPFGYLRLDTSIKQPADSLRNLLRQMGSMPMPSGTATRMNSNSSNDIR